MPEDKTLPIIGRAERIVLLDYDEQIVPAKVDTGADISSIWASQVADHGDTLSFVLFDKQSPCYSGKVIALPKGEYRRTRVANSFGTKEMRYVVKLRIRVNGKVVKTSFTLADRSLKIYPILLGRRLLKNRFWVDVARGEPLIEEEKKNKRKLRVELGLDED